MVDDLNLDILLGNVIKLCVAILLTCDLEGENAGIALNAFNELSLGGLGVISVLSNVAPRQTHDICAKFFEGDVKESCRLQLEAMDLIASLFCEVNPIPVKKAVSMIGFEAGPLRMPLSEIEEKNEERLRNSMKNYGLI